MKQKLDLSDAVQSSFKNGFKNFVPLLLTSILYSITVWIPYLNVGTTIALVGLPAKISRGEKIDPMDIFSAKYRDRIGDFFLVVGFQNVIVIAGFVFCIIPGIVMAYTYMFSALLVVDKDADPIKALGMSSELTKGNKLNIFLVLLILSIPMMIPVLNFIYAIIAGPVYLSALGYIYGKLSLEEEAVAVE